MNSTTIQQLKKIAPQLNSNQSLHFLLSIADDFTPGTRPHGVTSDDKLMNYGYHLGYEAALRTIRQLISNPEAFNPESTELISTFTS